VTLAAALLLWTQAENRWLRPTPRPQPIDVIGLTIDPSQVRHAKGSGAVVIVEFTDYECPFCAQHTRKTGPNIEKRLVETGIARHVVFNFPLERIHPRARKAAEAAECAARQGHYWEMHERLFSSDALSEQELMQFADALGLERTAFARCLAGEAAGTITADLAEGRRLGVDSTPTFFVGALQADGSIRLAKRLNGAMPFEDFQRVVEAIKRTRPETH
jgi:protein-disulfide isomerase